MAGYRLWSENGDFLGEYATPQGAERARARCIDDDIAEHGEEAARTSGALHPYGYFIQTATDTRRV